MALNFDGIDFTDVMHPGLVQMILDRVALKGGMDNRVEGLRVAQPVGQARQLDFTPAGADRMYRAVIRQEDTWQDFALSGDAGLAARDEGHADGAGFLRCFNLVIYDRVPSQVAPAGNPVVLVDAHIPYYWVSSGQLFIFDGDHLLAEPQGTITPL